MQKIEKKSFWALMVTQFFGAFNDNVLKVLVQLLIVEWVANVSDRSQLVDFSLAVFVAPFLIFSMIAGRLADRISKSRVIVAVQIWQLVVVGTAVTSLLMHSIPAMIGALFLLSMQAAFFSPAKYGVLPELMGENDLSYANGLLNSGTFLAILLGTVAGSFLVFRLPIACFLLVAASVGGLLSSFKMESLTPANPGGPLAWNPLSDLIANWKLIRQDQALKLSVIAVNYFWFMGAVLQSNVFLYGKVMMNASPRECGILLIAATVGIGLGSFLAGKLSSGKVELGLVPLGALGMSVFFIDLLWAWHSHYRTLFDLFMMGMSGGIYEVPLNSFVQWRSPPSDRGRILATVNFLSFVAIGFASIALWVLSTPLHLNPAQVLCALGVLSLVGTMMVFAFMPASVWRFILYVLVNSVYRIRIVGDQNIPVQGPALFVSNHLSLVDGFLVGAAVTRPVRFLIWRPYYEDKRFHWLMKAMKAIPISETDPPRAIFNSLLQAREALQKGELVCVFAEGQVSRTGNLLEFKKGFEVMVKGLNVPVIPVNLDRVWGSIFSFEHGRVMYKTPRKIPYPVTVTFGRALMSGATPADVRQAVMDLGADAFRFRLENREALPIEFLKRAKKQPRAFAVADSLGLQFSYGKLAAVSHVLADELERILPPGDCVGLLLPSSVGGALANLAVSLMGRIPVNLNYTSGAAAIGAAVTKAGIQRILTSRKLLAKAGLPVTENMIFLEDIAPTLSKARILREWILFWLLPTRAAIRRFGAKALRPLESTATIIFSSGSTGVPKGVVLTHANILANILGLSQVFDLGREDRMIGVLPFFHSFGFTATLWFPLIHGFSAVYHVNPLEAKTVGELAGKYKATVLLATPSFLAAYTRKCTADQFQYLRFVITGAERLRASVAAEFEAKFGKIPLEGYGCTELSPVATVNVPDISMDDIRQVGHKTGMIGHPLPGVSVHIVSPETFEPLPQGEAGLLLVKGLNVMKGYLNEPEKTAEVIRDGWYVTGDIALVDHDGFVRLVDRLSRFSKIAGEMIPHISVEEKLQQLSGHSEPIFAVTSVYDEKKGEELIVLYCRPEGIPVTIDDLYRKLQASDLPKLWIPVRNHFFEIPGLPVLGTGKLDLSAIRKIALEKMKVNLPD